MKPWEDREGSYYNNEKSLEVVNSINKTYILADVWRIQNPKARTFSWYRARPKLTASRLDFALISTGLIDMCENSGYITGINTDHLAFYVYFMLSETKRGPGYWKLNTTLLTDKRFLEHMNEFISNYFNTHQYMNIVNRWEFFKCTAREEMIKFSKNITSERNLVIAQLSEKVTEMELNLTAVDLNLLEKTKTDLEQFQMEKTKSCIFR